MPPICCLKVKPPSTDWPKISLAVKPIIDSIALTGHTDRLGSEQYNYNLGLQRAQTVKNYLQGKGVQAPISVASAGESQPVTTACTGTRATAALKACLQPDRRVTVDISGTAAQ